MNVVMTCRPVCSQNARSAGEASWRTTPLPASITGRLAPWMISAARSRLTGSASIIGSGPRGSGAPVDHASHDVLGQLEVRRAGLLGGGDAERLAHRLGDHARVVEAGVPLGHGPQHLDGVDELVGGLLVHAGEAGLAGERHQRSVVEVRVADAGGEVAGARAERREADAGPAGEAPVGVGHEGRALLVPRGHEGDELRAVERLAEVERLLAGDAEDELDALVLQAVDEEVGGGARWSPAGAGGKTESGRWSSTSSLAFRGLPASQPGGPACSDGQDAGRGGRSAARSGTRGRVRRGGRRACAAGAPPWPRRRWRRRRGRGSPARRAPAGSRPPGRSCRRCRCTG